MWNLKRSRLIIKLDNIFEKRWILDAYELASKWLFTVLHQLVDDLPSEDFQWNRSDKENEMSLQDKENRLHQQLLSQFHYHSWPGGGPHWNIWL